MLSRRGHLALAAYCRIALLQASIARLVLAPGPIRRTKSCIVRAPFATNIQPRRRASISPDLFEPGTAGDKPPGLRRDHAGDHLPAVTPVGKRPIAPEISHRIKPPFKAEQGVTEPRRLIAFLLYDF